MTGGNVKAVCQWIGNTPAVAMAHYAQVTDADFKEAAEMTILNDAEKGIHHHIQPTAEPSHTEPHETPEHIAASPDNCESKLELAGACESTKMGGTGLEPVASCL
ncbi:MAG: hypothetical protein WCE45_05050 [Sedimentisphaerales bacterium]